MLLLQVLACIGEQFTDGDEINGIAVVIRARGDRIELWTRTASNEAAQVRSPCRRHACIYALTNILHDSPHML